MKIRVNWLGIVLISYWVSATVGTYFTKNSEPYVCALIATVLTGFGYFLYITTR